MKIKLVLLVSVMTLTVGLLLSLGGLRGQAPGLAEEVNAQQCSDKILILLQGIGSDYDGRSETWANVRAELSNMGYAEIIDFSYRLGDFYDYSQSDTYQGLDASREALRRIVADRLAHCEGATFDLVGHSLGGAVAWHFVSSLSGTHEVSRVRHVVTLDSPVNGSSPLRDSPAWLRRFLDATGIIDWADSDAARNLIEWRRQCGDTNCRTEKAKQLERQGTLVRSFSSHDDTVVPPEDASISGYTVDWWDLGRWPLACSLSWAAYSSNASICEGHDQILRGEVPASVRMVLQTNPKSQPEPISTVTPPPNRCIGVRNAQFVADSNFPDGTSVSAGQVIQKKWRVRNSGTCPWDSGYHLVFDHGDTLGGSSTSVPALAPNQEGDVSVTFTMPQSSGRYVSYWRLVDPYGVNLGDILWLDVNVSGQSAPQSDSASFVTQSLYPTKSPGESLQIFFTVKNTGSSVWTPGSYWLANINGQTLGANAVQGLGDNVYPGQEKTWTINMTAPSQSGTYRTQWMISHNGALFGPNMFIDVTVGGGPPNDPPDRPQLLAPYDWYVTIGNPPELRWQKGGDPNGDPVNECFVRAEGATIWESGWIAAESATPSGLGYWNYGWKVKCRDNRGAESDWSDTWHFSVASPDVTINDVHFDPAGPSAADSVKIFACTDGRAGLGITMRVSVNDATDGSANGNWHIIKELGVPCFNDIDAPVWYTLEYGDGVHRVRTEAFPQDPNIWTGGDTRDDYYTLQRRRPPSPQQLGPSASDNPFVWLNNASIEFRWNESIRASGYRLIVSPNPNPDLDLSPLVSVNLPPGSTSYTADLGGDYPRLYWFIDASNELGYSASTAPFGIDSVPPESSVSALPSAVPDTTFQVSWDGSDDSSGVRAYDVQVRDGTRGDWVDWLANTTSKTALFQGQAGHTYYFRSRAVDNGNNYEPYVDGDGDTYTMIDRSLGGQTAWWDQAYGFKRTVLVLNNDSRTMVTGHPVGLHFDSTTSPSAQAIYDASQSSVKGDDVRVVFNDQVELDRFVANFSPSAIDIYFRVQEDISSSQTSSYQLYYGNPSASSPPGNINTVFYPDVDSNTVGVWHAFECQGSTVSDSSGNGNNGTKGSDVFWDLNAPFGCALNMPNGGSAGYEGVVIPASSSLAVNAFTFEIVAKRTQNGTLAFQGESGSARERWQIRADGSRADIQVWAQGGSSTVGFDNFFPLNEWHHYAVTFDGNRTVRLYRDGGFFGAKDLPVSGISSGSSFFRIGAGIGGGNIAMDRIGAVVQHARLSNVVRTSFPYAVYGLINQPPSLAAGDESAKPQSQGTPDLVVQSVATYTTDTGEQLVAAVVSNIGDGDSANGFYIDLYDGHQPSGPGDLQGSIKFWVASPIPAGSDVVLTATLPPPMGPMMFTASSSAIEETTETLYVQADSTGAVSELDKGNNISAPTAACFASSDTLEPDNDATAAKPVEVNAPGLTHNADIPGDEDWVSFTAEAGKAYRIRTANLAPSADTVLYLYSTDATILLASNDDSNASLASEIAWTAPQSGTYFVKVAQWNPNVGGCGTSYDLSIQLASPAPVGGIAELPDVAASPLETRASPGLSVGALIAIAAAAAAGALSLAGAAWYGRRRWLKP